MTTARVQDVAWINRRTLPETTDPDFEFKYVDIGAVSEGRVAVPRERVKFSSAPSRARRKARTGDVLVSTVRTYLRAIAPVPKVNDELVFSTGFAVLEAKPQVDSRYLAYFCLGTPFVQGVESRSVGVSYPAVNAGDIGKMAIDLPPLEEQRRIADFLDAETTRIDKLVSALDRKLELLAERRRTGVTHHVLDGDSSDRRRSQLPWATTVPTHWDEARLGLVAHMGSGHTPSRSKPEWWVDCTIPWVTTGEVRQLRDDRLEDLVETREKISALGLANSAAELHPKGTVFLCRTASAGYSGVMGADMATSQDFVTWTCGPRLNPYYLLWCLRAMRPDLLGRLATGSTHLTIYVPDLQMLRIPLPSVEEQQKLVDRIRRQNRQIDSMVDKVRRQIELMKERRQALITAAVTGEFDVSAASGRGIEE